MDEKEFKHIISKLQPDLLSIARKILGDEDDAKDVVQDALLCLWQLKEEVGNIHGFARILVRNKSLDLLRKQKSVIQTELVDTICMEDCHDDRIEKMMTMIEKLPTMQQTILRLRHIHGMEMSEIAEIIGTTEQAIRQSLSRARRTILREYNKKP